MSCQESFLFPLRVAQPVLWLINKNKESTLGFTFFSIQFPFCPSPSTNLQLWFTSEPSSFTRLQAPVPATDVQTVEFGPTGNQRCFRF